MGKGGRFGFFVGFRVGVQQGGGFVQFLLLRLI